MQLLHRGTAYNLQGGNQTHRPHFGMTAAFLDARHKPVIPLPAKLGRYPTLQKPRDSGLAEDMIVMEAQ